MLIKCGDGKTINTDNIKDYSDKNRDILSLEIAEFLEEESAKEAYQITDYPAYMALIWAIKQKTSFPLNLADKSIKLCWKLYDQCVESETKSFDEQTVDYSKIPSDKAIFENSDEFVYMDDINNLIKQYCSNRSDKYPSNEELEEDSLKYRLPIRATLFELLNAECYPEMVTAINNLKIYRITEDEVESRKIRFKDGSIDCGKLKDHFLANRFSRKLINYIITRMNIDIKDKEKTSVSDALRIISDYVGEKCRISWTIPPYKCLIYEFEGGTVDVSKLLDKKIIQDWELYTLSEMQKKSIDDAIAYLKAKCKNGQEEILMQCITQEAGSIDSKDSSGTEAKSDEIVYDIHEDEMDANAPKSSKSSQSSIYNTYTDTKDSNAELKELLAEIERLNQELTEANREINELRKSNQELQNSKEVLKAENDAYRKKLEDIGDILRS